MTGHSKLAAAAGVAAAVLVVVPCAIKAVRRGDDGKARSSKKTDYEFGGPLGAFATMLGLPGVIIFLCCACGKDYRVPGADFRRLADMPLPRLEQFISARAVAICAGWFGFQVFLERVLPGPVVEGVDLAPAGGSGRLSYRLNGHSAFWASLLGLASARGGLATLYDEFTALAGASTCLSAAFSAYLYAASFAEGALLARGGDSGNAVYDFFIGRELNPRIGSLDLKQFCELRPGLIGWMALNLGMAAKQFQNTGAVSGSMVLVNVLQGLYVWDALYQEQAILSTMDITTDGFGYMLAFGDLAWVPFTYSLQACLGLGGYAVFRASNSQKDLFRRDPAHPQVAHLEAMEVQNLQTGKPSKLLVTGWWGLARKINYTGDWVMACAWSLLTGPPLATTGSIIAYFYPIYFAVLLIHRAGRDDHFCSEKYGEGWKEYKQRVPYVFIPYLI